MPANYPVSMLHPQFSPAVMVDADAFESAVGKPARYPPVQVHNAQQEEEQRARGYLRPGEAAELGDGYHEFPKIMRHPDYEPATKDITDAQMVDGRLQTYVIKGSPGKHPDKTVNSPKEEAHWREQGYISAGDEDPIAYGRALAAPGLDEHKAEE